MRVVGLYLAAIFSIHAFAESGPSPAETTLSALEKAHLSFNPKGMKRDEDRYIEMLKELEKPPADQSAAVTKMLRIIHQKFILSARLVSASLGTIEKWPLDQAEIDQLVKGKAAFLEAVAQHKKRNGEHSNNITMWRFATEAEINEAAASFDRAICKRPLRPGLKKWQYDLIIAGRNETQWRDQHQRILCPR